MYDSQSAKSERLQRLTTNDAGVNWVLGGRYEGSSLGGTPLGRERRKTTLFRKLKVIYID